MQKMRAMTRRILAVSLSVLAALALVASAVAFAAGPRGAIANCGLVLKKLDFTSPPHYPTDPNLYNDLSALNNDVQNVQNILTDPSASEGWCEAIQDVHSLSSTSLYFNDTGGANQAREEFLQDWALVKRLAGCE